MRCLISTGAVLVVGAALMVVAQPTPAPIDVSDQYADFFERCEAFRTFQIGLNKLEATTCAANLKRLKTNGSAQKEIDEITNRIRIATEKLSALNDYTKLISAPINKNSAVGDWGTASFGATVYQKIADDEAILRMRVFDIVSGEPQISVINLYFKGTMADQTAGKEFQGRFPIAEMTGEYSYTTTLGGTASMPIFQVADEAKLREQFQLWMEKRLAKEAAQKQTKSAQAAKERDLQEAQAKTESEQMKKDEEARTAAKREKDAENALNGAKFLKESGNIARAKDRLREIIRDFPGTKAAKEAADLVAKW